MSRKGAIWRCEQAFGCLEGIGWRFCEMGRCRADFENGFVLEKGLFGAGAGYDGEQCPPYAGDSVAHPGTSLASCAMTAKEDLPLAHSSGVREMMSMGIMNFLRVLISASLVN